MKKVPEISRADYDTILLHAEKISNGQHDFAPVLRRELRDKLNIANAGSLIADLVKNKNVEFLNRVRLFLSRFPFVVTRKYTAAGLTGFKSNLNGRNKRITVLTSLISSQTSVN